MTGLVFLALLNGALIAASRSINGRLGMSVGALQSSFWNHLGGFLLLTAFMAAVATPELGKLLDAPVPAYFGGVLGALFVAMNSRALPRIGAVPTLTLIIGGQMAAGLAIDWIERGMQPTAAQLGALPLIVVGTMLMRKNGSRHGERR